MGCTTVKQDAIREAVRERYGRIAEGTEEGTEWADDIEAVVAAYNKTPHEGVHGRPDKVKTNPIQEFLVLQDNADKAQHNNQLLAARKKALEKTAPSDSPRAIW